MVIQYFRIKIINLYYNHILNGNIVCDFLRYLVAKSFQVYLWSYNILELK